MTGQLKLFDDGNEPKTSLDYRGQVLEPIQLDKDRAVSPADLVPLDSQFRFTNNYNISGSLIGRMLRALADRANQSDFTREALASELTIPSERIESMFRFVRKAELSKTKNKLTAFGRLILDNDPYFLNTGSLWFLHFLIASNANIIIWSRLFDIVFRENDEVSPGNITQYYSDVRRGMKERVFQYNGAKELGAVLRTYADDMFRPLNLVMRLAIGRYAVLTDEFPIPLLIWLASILVYRDRYYPNAATLETHLLVDAHFSPGRLFRQTEKTVRQVLDGLHNAGQLTVESHLGLDQVRFKNEITWLSALARYFEEGR